MANPQQPKYRNLLRLLWLVFPVIAAGHLLFSLLHYGFSPAGNNPGFELVGGNRQPTFHDLKWVLSFSACEGDLRELLTSNTPCLGYGDPQYPVLPILMGRWIGLGPQDAGWIGILSGVGVMAVLAHVCWLCTRETRTWSIIITMMWLSFPLQFLLERGNLDSIIFLLTALFCLMVWQRGWASVLFANAIAALTVTFKIYPVLTVIGWLIYSIKAPMAKQRKRSLAWSLLLTTPISLLFTYLSFFSSKITTGAGGLYSHGLTAIGYANTFLLSEFGYQLGRLSIRSLFVFKAVSLLIGFIYGMRWARNLALPKSPQPTKANTSLAHSYAQTLIMVTAAVGIGCYIISIGYDYRLVFILPLLGLIACNLQGNTSLRPKNRWFLALLLAASAYIFTLPFATGIDSRSIHFLELIDESILSPFLFAGLAAAWIQLLLPARTVNEQGREA